MYPIYIKFAFQRLLYLLCILSFHTSLWSQEKAVTLGGDTIYIFSDFTWSYSTEKPELKVQEAEFMPYYVKTTSKILYKTPVNSKSFLTKEEKPYSLYYDESKWKRILPSSLNEEADFALQTKNDEIYAMIIYEEVEIGLENIFSIAMDNIKTNIGVEPEVLHSEYRTVNGIEMIYAEYKVVTAGMKFIFASHFYSGKIGTFQYTAWTFENVFPKKKQLMEELLIGLEIR